MLILICVPKNKHVVICARCFEVGFVAEPRPSVNFCSKLCKIYHNKLSVQEQGIKTSSSVKYF